MSEVDWDEVLGKAVELESATWVTVREAAEASGASRSTIRAWYRAGDIPSRMADGPHGPERQLPLEAVLERAGSARLRGTRRDADLVRQLVELVNTQAAEIAVLRHRLDELDRRL